MCVCVCVCVGSEWICWVWCAKKWKELFCSAFSRWYSSNGNIWREAKSNTRGLHWTQAQFLSCKSTKSIIRARGGENSCNKVFSLGPLSGKNFDKSFIKRRTRHAFLSLFYTLLVVAAHHMNNCWTLKRCLLGETWGRMTQVGQRWQMDHRPDRWMEDGCRHLSRSHSSQTDQPCLP